MIGTAASRVYGRVAEARRRWLSSPGRQRRLTRPVISVGNVRAGGAGKTPAVAAIASQLSARGERPAILSRGYARRRPLDGVTVVSDGQRILSGVDTAGDEPLMLAHQLPDVLVLVGADRYLSGCLAERLGASVHLLDDGFQHVQLARDVDLVLVDEDDLSDRVLPAGSLREPLSAAVRADALLVTGPDPTVDALRRATGVPTAFRVTRVHRAPRLVHAAGTIDTMRLPARALAFAGIARPQRFFADLKAAGWDLAGTVAFPDHHHYDAADVRRIAADARSAGASVVVTTEKDAVRWPGGLMPEIALAAMPMAVEIEAGFAEWLAARLAVPGGRP